MRSANTASTSDTLMPQDGHQQREQRRDLEGLEVARVGEQRLKLSSPTHSVDMPKASCSWNDCSSAWPAGQKKNTPMTASCGCEQHPGQPGGLKQDAFFH